MSLRILIFLRSHTENSNNTKVYTEKGILVMAEVSHIRNAANRTRPLGEVKDDIAYMVEQDSRYAPRDDFNDQAGDVQKMKDVKESIRHAALINIVAAVNDSCDDETNSSHLLEQTQRSTDGNMTLISNLVFHRDRSISIPKPQVFFEPPKTLSTKKPLYYRNSKDEVLEDIEQRKRCVSLTRTRMSVGTPEDESEKSLSDRPKSERLQFSVSIQQLKDTTKSDPPNPPWLEKPSKVKNARSMSPRRRFVSLNKKIETKSISKCEAVDIMDATECLQNRYNPPSSVSHIESYGEQVDNSDNDSSMYRARSLPSLFPVKKKKEPKVSDKNENGSSGAEKEKTKLISPFKRPSATAYGCLPNMVMGKTIQTKSESESTLIQEQKFYKRVEKVSSAIKETISKFETPTESPKTDGAIISLEGRSIPNPRNTSLSGNSKPRETRILNRPQTGPDYMKMNSAQEQSVLHDLGHHFGELQKSQRSSQWSGHMNPSTQSTDHDIANYGLVGRKFKSKLKEKMASEKSKSLVQKMGFKPKSTKRVTFAPVEDRLNNNNNNGSEDFKSFVNSVCEGRQDSSRTKRSINQVRIGSSSMKAVSSGELSRLKKRIIPEEFNSDTKPKYDVLDNIRISSMSSREGSVLPRPPSRMSDVRSMASEGATSSYFDEVAFDWNGRETDAADRASSSVPKSYGASSFYPDSTKIKLNFNHYKYDDSDESSEEEDENDETYRIVKAVDLGTLSGYQHRKFRKPSTNLETSTTHFVKIKVK